MAKSKLASRMLIGAVIGGVTALTDPGVRTYVKDKWLQVKLGASICAQQPSFTLETARQAFNEFTANVDTQAGNVINAVEQIEQTVSRVKGGNKDKIELEVVK